MLPIVTVEPQSTVKLFASTNVMIGALYIVPANLLVRESTDSSRFKSFCPKPCLISHNFPLYDGDDETSTVGTC